ncbi:MAG: hypothetical protein J5486_09355 [Bacteroidaceae bacterium]|nr:hypothetical protein [Bacteroidaceae bacterium]
MRKLFPKLYTPLSIRRGGGGEAFLLLFFLFLSCEQEDNTYSRRHVSWGFSPSTSVTILHNALNSPGEYVTVRKDVSGTKFLFHSLKSDLSWPMTELDRRTTIMGLSGFIIGLPTMPELGYTVSHPVCYELTCINCYNNDSYARDVTLQAGGQAKCDRCGRVYDLNNQGIIISDHSGLKLDRYRISYSGGVTNAVSVY